MHSLITPTKFAVLALCGLLAISLGLYKSAESAEQMSAKTQNEPLVTDCYESREGYTTVTRVEGAVPQYGYPNIKCSQKTGAVLWYGDPYEGTVPMGEMPEITDATRGNYANAVVKPREPRLMYFNMGPDGCKTCHDGKTVPAPKNKKPRELAMHQDIVENSMQLMHGRGSLWCLDCHSATDRNKLENRQGVQIGFNQPQRLCGTCHGELYIDWRAGIHGKRTGDWAANGKKRWWVCTECHNPHTVQVNRFNPIKQEAPPALPRGMKNADHERMPHGEH
ncbi:MAG: cytochrome c3 family protein [Gallionella sp.]|nr:cytochrome c3 family protein [Gallionella sp.]